MQAATRSVIFYCERSSLQLCNEGRPLENQKLKWHVFVSIDARKKSELWYTVCSMLPCRSKTAGGTVLAEGHCAPR